MSQMKDSGIKWIGEIPKEWTTSKTKYIFQVISGSTPNSDYSDYWDGPINWITPADMNDVGHIASGERYITEKGYKSCGTTVVPAKSIIISNRAPIGKINIAVNELCTNQGCKCLVNEKYNSNSYYYYYYIANKEQLVNLGRGTTFKELSTTDLQNFEVIVLSIQEQQLIADFLDNKISQIDNILENLNKQIDLLNKYKMSLITEIVTKGLNPNANMKVSGIDWIGLIPEHWECKKIKYLINGMTDGTHGTFDRVDSGKLLLSAKNVFENGIVIGSNESEISEKDYKMIVSNGFPRKGDVLLCCVGTIGRCTVYNFDESIAFQRSVIFMRCNELIIPEMMKYCMQSNGTCIQEKLMINKSAQEGLYQGSVKELILVFPKSKNMQKEIVKYLDKKCAEINELIVDKQMQIKKMEQYKKSLIYEYVTGKKRVKGAEELYG